MNTSREIEDGSLHLPVFFLDFSLAVNGATFFYIARMYFDNCILLSSFDVMCFQGDGNTVPDPKWAHSLQCELNYSLADSFLESPAASFKPCMEQGYVLGPVELHRSHWK